MTPSFDSVHTMYKEITTPENQEDLQGHSYLPLNTLLCNLNQKTQ